VGAACPSGEASPDVVLATVAQASRFIDRMTPALRAVGLATVGMLEVSTVRRRFGYRRFSQLPPDEARRALTWMQQAQPRSWRGVRLLRDVAVVSYYEQREIRRSVGYDPDPFIEVVTRERTERRASAIEAHRLLLVASAPRPTGIPEASTGAGGAPPSSPRVSNRSPAGDLRSARDGAMSDLRCDVVVVGSGAGGSVVAAELAEAGLSVIILEEGGHHRTEEFTSDTAEMLEALYRNCGVSSTLGRTPVAFSEGRCVGGSTVVNGAMAFRAPERVLDRWAREAEVPGLAGAGLDREFERVERFLSVSTMDEGSVGRDQELLRNGALRLGWRVIDNTRAQLHCGGCNVCTWGCPTGAKQSTLVSYLPRAVAFGATIRSDCRVDRILFRGKRAIGVQGRVTAAGPGGEAGTAGAFTVHASHVVVCGGAIQTPALLQRSGVRSPSGQLGRNLALHPGAGVAAVFDDLVDGWKGAHQAYQIREFEREGFVMAAVNLPPSLVARSLPLAGDDLGAAMALYNRTVTAGVLVQDTTTGRVQAFGREGTVATYRVDDRSTARIVRATLLLCEALLAAGARVIYLPFEGVGAVHKPDDLRRVAALPISPGDLSVSTVHLMGTARLGADPTHAVCDPWGAVYDRVGVSVADASLFPTPIGVNPMLTVQALATRVSWHIADGWPR
jgi:choline dehydrogenase-like flavoprotein